MIFIIGLLALIAAPFLLARSLWRQFRGDDRAITDAFGVLALCLIATLGYAVGR